MTLSNRTNYIGSATAAYLRGQEDGPDSLFWLKRARRLAPEDPRILLDIARRELSAGYPKAQSAYENFQHLSEQYDIAPVWIGLAIAAQMLGDAASAARALHSFLTRHCLPDDPSFPGFARDIAISAGYDGWQGYEADCTLVSKGSGRLLGSNPDLTALTQVEGLVEWTKSGLRGWAARTACPDYPPHLILTDECGQTLTVKCGSPLPSDETAPFLVRYKFNIPFTRLKDLTPPFKLSGVKGKPFMGSPIDPRSYQTIPVAAEKRGPSLRKLPPKAPLALVMPVYRGQEETQAAIKSVLKYAPPETRFIVVEDASPEPRLRNWLQRLAQTKKIELLQHAENQGFCGAANTGLSAAKGHDVLLLNSDILMSESAIQTMRNVAYADPATGTVTPLSNEATICSYPDPRKANPMPDQAQTNLLDRLAKKANGCAAVEIPTGVGFCLYIRHDCLDRTGLFRKDLFAQGYGEENDFCLRARHIGYNHKAAMGAYVAHKGGVSFKSATKALNHRNLTILNNLFPGYQDLVMAHIDSDPAKPYRSTLDKAKLLHQQGKRSSVLLISHAHGGGVARQVDRVAQNYRAKGITPLILTTKFPANPSRTKYPWPSLLSAGEAGDFPNLSFVLPEAMAELLTLLRQLKTTRVELHHMLGQHEAVRGIASALGVPMDVVGHDYASFCPRVNLLAPPSGNAPRRYCGEPDISGCETCCRQSKVDLHERIPVKRLLARSEHEFASADRIIVPSTDMARRLSRHFPKIHPQVIPWEDDALPMTLNKPRSGPRRIGILGGIGYSKGFDVLLECAQDQQRRQLPLDFIVIGSSADDAKLLKFGVKVTGFYKPHESELLIRESAPDLIFLPSIWPETWCFVLSEAWRAGLYTVVFDLGAQAERVRATGRGAILPLGLPPERINNSLLSVTF